MPSKRSKSGAKRLQSNPEKISGKHSDERGKFNGFDLFLRFADGCRHYLDDRGTISKEDSNEIRAYLEERGVEPSEEILRRVYHVAYPGLEKVCRRLRRESIFERKVVREFYAFDHNRMKLEQGNLICLAYPARVREVRLDKPAKPGAAPKAGCSAIVELEPVTGLFQIDSDFPLEKGDWVIIHRMRVIERIDKAFADRTIGFLRKLGLDKSRRFPRKAYKYLTELKYSSDSKHKRGMRCTNSALSRKRSRGYPQPSPSQGK